MLVRLAPKDIAIYWSDVILPAITDSLPIVNTIGTGDTNKLLEALLMETAQCWFSKEEGVEEEFRNLCITIPVKDELLGMHSLLLYVVSGEGITKREWFSGYKNIMAFAKVSGFDFVSGYTHDTGLVKMAERAGGVKAQYYITVPVPKD